MAIQFRCAQCGHPIEVDEQHAGQTAACPYCRHVMSVPSQSTYQPDVAVAARPLEAGDVAQGPAEQPGPPVARRRHNARRFGSYALSCMLLALALFAIGFTRFALVLRGSGALWAATQPTAEQMSDFERQVRQVGMDPWFALPVDGGLFFALVGLVLGIVSLTQGVSGNWPGLLVVIVCGAFFFCICAGVVMMAVMGVRVPTG